MEKVKRYDTVKVHYTLSVDGMGVVETTNNGEPLMFTLGAGHVVPGFEKAVKGMTIGQNKIVLLTPDEGYGDYDDELVIKVPKCNLPKGIELKEGMLLQAGDQAVKVKAVYADGALIDLNTPLAGEFLSFDITLLEIIPATKAVAPKATKKVKSLA